MFNKFSDTIYIAFILFIILMSVNSIYAENSTDISNSTDNASVSSYSNLTDEFNNADDMPLSIYPELTNTIKIMILICPEVMQY